jgi:hypothetical protein
LSSEKILLDEDYHHNYLEPTSGGNLSYPSDYGSGYWFSSNSIQGVKDRNYGKELKLQYAYNFENLYTVVGVNFSIWKLGFHGVYTSSKSFFKMPEPFQQQINTISHTFRYLDRTTYLQIPIGVGVNLANPMSKFKFIPILRINPEFQLKKKVLENSMEHHYYFHSESFDFASNHYEGYHLDETVKEENANELMKFDIGPKGLANLNFSQSLLFGYQITEHFGWQFEMAYKISARRRIELDPNYQKTHSLNFHFGVTYSI